MTITKRVSLSISENLLAELDAFASIDRRRRNELLGEALEWYLHERRRIHMQEEMRRGYLEMAAINLKLAKEGAEGEALSMTVEWEDSGWSDS